PMPDRRDTLIAEMGLGPVWKLRSAASEPDSAVAAQPERVFEPEPIPVSRYAPGSTARTSNVRPTDVRTMEPPVSPRTAPVPGRPADISEARAEGVVPPSTPHDPQREQAILRMDWPDLKNAVAQCTACGLCRTRRNTVFGVGDEAAEWMIV